MATIETRRGRDSSLRDKIVAVPLMLLCLLAIGCNRETNKPVFGAVRVDNGQSQIFGRVIFVPIENTAAPSSHARIVDGAYRIDARGGMPPGEYRVQVEAKRKTGRKIPVVVRGETVMTDEMEPLGSEIYATADSPLIVTLTADSDGRIDLDVPKSE